MSVAIVGGGIMGISLGYFLTQRGVQVDIYEASPELGGLAGAVSLPDGTRVDRFYHAILSSDSHLRQLCAELGLESHLRFHQTRMGFYHRGALYSMNNMVEFLRFPPLGWVDRFRLGLTVLTAQLVRDWQSLEAVSVEDWLVRWSGRKTYQNIWRPMLKAKFDGGFENTPATYIWSRLVRMKSTRNGASQKEEAGYLRGGYSSLLQTMAERITAAGGRIFLRQPVEEILIEDGRAVGLRLGVSQAVHAPLPGGIHVDDPLVGTLYLPSQPAGYTYREGESHSYDAVVATVPLPRFRSLIPGADADYLGKLDRIQYLGIVTLLLALDRPLTGYWTLNITDDRYPFTGVIETTAYIDPQDVGGHHLVYLPKYTAPDSPWQRMTDEDIEEAWLAELEAMLPSFRREQVRYCLVQRERHVEPLHGLNQTDWIPQVKTPVEGLYLATTAQIYPALTNGESITRHGRAVAAQVAQAS